MVKTTINKYKWEGWLSVGDLARKFDVSKRRIQQVVRKQIHNLQCRSATLVLACGDETDAYPVYKLFGWFYNPNKGDTNGTKIKETTIRE